MGLRPRPAALRRALPPIAVGLLVLVAALVVPVHPVAGSVASGPVYPRLPAPDWRPGQVSVAWTPGHRGIALRVRTGARCRPVLGPETSTAPARVEVALVLRHDADCAAHPRLWRFVLRPPRVVEPGQASAVYVDGQHFDLPRYRR